MLNRKTILNNWYFKSVLIGLCIGAISLIFIPHLKFGIFVFVLVSSVLILNNPKRRYIIVFRILIITFIALNRFSFWIIGQINDAEYGFASLQIELAVNISLLALSGFALLLDYLERKENLQHPKTYLIKLFERINIFSNNTISIIRNKHNSSNGENPKEIKIKEKIISLYTCIIENSINNEEDIELVEDYKKIKQTFLKYTPSLHKKFVNQVHDFLESDYYSFKNAVLDGKNNPNNIS